MPEETSLVVRRETPPTLLALQGRVRQGDLRLRDAAKQLGSAFHALTPAAQLDERPIRWVAVAFVVGFALALLTGSPHPRRSR